MKAHYQLLIDTCNPETPKEFFSTNLNDSTAKVEAKKTVTLGDYLNQLIKTMQNGDDNRKPSKNYQGYINLLHKLEKEGVIINVPLSEIDNRCFISFGKFILNLPPDKGRSNYANIMKLFKCVHNKAFNHELNNNVLRFDYMKDAPVKDTKKRISLSEKQYQKFVNMDLSAIAQSGHDRMYYKELYRDFCVFLYEMKMRPADLVRLHSNDICVINGKTNLTLKANVGLNLNAQEKQRKS
jgi:hypothetical protein